MNNKELISKLSERLGITQKLASEMVDTTASAIVSSVSEDRSLMLQGFGSFEVRKKNNRVITNPSTGYKMVVPPKLVLTFKPSGIFKGEMKKEKGE